jgi:hypothetical protein
MRIQMQGFDAGLHIEQIFGRSYARIGAMYTAFHMKLPFGEIYYPRALIF